MLFTEEELNEFDKDGLKSLCSFFEIEITDKTSKKKMIELLSEYMKEQDAKEGQMVSPMSVQVKRIYDRLKGEIK